MRALKKEARVSRTTSFQRSQSSGQPQLQGPAMSLSSAMGSGTDLVGDFRSSSIADSTSASSPVAVD